MCGPLSPAQTADAIPAGGVEPWEKEKSAHKAGKLKEPEELPPGHHRVTCEQCQQIMEIVAMHRKWKHQPASQEEGE